MQVKATNVGPVSERLEQELRAEINRHGIVVWLDKDNSYAGFVDALKDRSPTPVVPFRGSFLEMMLALEDHGGGLEKPPLLVHMPGFNEETIRETPVLELYRPGYRFRKSLDTLIREAATSKVTPAELDRFVATMPTLEIADAWLADATRDAGFGLAAQLHQIGPTMLVQALSEKASRMPLSLSKHVKNEEEDLRTLRTYAHKLTGIDDTWLGIFERSDDKERAEEPLRGSLAALGAWLLSVEYVHDLRREPYIEHPRARHRCGRSRSGAAGERPEHRLILSPAHGTHRHHVVPVSKIRKSYVVDPIRDLRPLCPNCHAAIHGTDPLLVPEKMRESLKNSRASRSDRARARTR